VACHLSKKIKRLNAALKVLREFEGFGEALNEASLSRILAGSVDHLGCAFLHPAIHLNQLSDNACCKKGDKVSLQTR
jgi:hypothetical protein